MRTVPQEVRTVRSPRVRRILRAIAICLVLLHATQALAGDLVWAAVVAIALSAAVVFGAFLDVLRSVRTAVVLLTLLVISCTLGTLTVQRSQVNAESEAEFCQTVEFAWAHLLVKISHPRPRDVEIPPAHEQRLVDMGIAFGEEKGQREREKAVGQLRATADEAVARDLARAVPGFFGALYRIASALRLTDLYSAWWFIGLFYLLAANLVVGAVVRRKPSVRNLGFHGAHLGLVVVVLGATVGAFTSSRGVMPMSVGESDSRYVRQHPMAALPLGFSVRLDRFDTLYHEDLAIELLGSGGEDPHHGMSMGGLRSTEKLELGKSFELTDPGTGSSWSLTMAEITEGTELQRTYVPAAAGDAPAAVRMELRHLGAAEAQFDDLWISSVDPVYVSPDNGFKVQVQAGALPGPDGASIGCPVPGVVGSFVLEQQGGGALVAPVEVGTTVAHGGLSVTFEEVVPDFRVGKTEGRPDEYPRNPVLKTRIEGPDGHSGDFLFFSDSRLQGFTQLPWEGFEGLFEYDLWCTPTAARVLLRVDSAGSAAALIQGPEGPGELVALAEGRRLDLPGGGSVSVSEILPAAAEETQLIRSEPGAPGAHTALRIHIDGPGDDTERWLLSNSPHGAMMLADDAGSGFALLLADNTARPPRDWRSHLTFLEEGEKAGGGVTEVNVPVLYKGFRFFQSDADPRRPDYSGLQVVYDPAWPLVASGLWLLLLGICWCFYVQPLFDRRRRQTGEAP